MVLPDEVMRLFTTVTHPAMDASTELGLLPGQSNGAAYFLLGMALLNIFRAVFNLLPFPFLDGGQIVRVFIAKGKLAAGKRKIPEKS
jgi:membrane-associated protease RseP (regulator of RpoE activity)